MKKWASTGGVGGSAGPLVSRALTPPVTREKFLRASIHPVIPADRNMGPPPPPVASPDRGRTGAKPGLGWGEKGRQEMAQKMLDIWTNNMDSPDEIILRH